MGWQSNKSTNPQAQKAAADRQRILQQQQAEQEELARGPSSEKPPR